MSSPAATPAPSATVIEIAQAITGMVQALEGCSCAVMDLVPNFDIPAIKTLQIVVAPQSYV